MEQEQVTSIADAFSRVDANGDGVLTRAELIKALRKDPSLQALLQLPGKVGDEQRAAFEEVFQGMDADDDRSISCVEFTEFIAKQMGLRPPARPGSAAGDRVGKLPPLVATPPPKALADITPVVKYDPFPLNAKAVAALAEVRNLPPSDWLTAWRSRGGQAEQCHRPTGIDTAGPEFLKQQIRIVVNREKGPFGDPIWLESGDDSDVQISFGRLGMAVGDSKLISLAPLFRCAAAKLSRLNLGG